MKESADDNTNTRQFKVRDWLALDRTVLANERTFLAYARTALTLFIAGLTFIKFFGHLIYAVIGYVFIALGFVVFAIGVKRFFHIMRHYRRLAEVGEKILPEELKKELRTKAEGKDT